MSSDCPDACACDFCSWLAENGERTIDAMLVMAKLKVASIRRDNPGTGVEFCVKARLDHHSPTSTRVHIVLENEDAVWHTTTVGFEGSDKRAQVSRLVQYVEDMVEYSRIAKRCWDGATVGEA